VSRAPVETPHTLRSIQQMLGISRRVITELIAAGFVSPSRGPRNEYRFSFQDVVLLRTAHALQAARIQPRRILRSLQRLRASLPEELPLTGLRITAIGNEIAVHEGDTRWEPESGQLLMDFEVAPAGGQVKVLPRATEPDAHALFATAQELEARDPAAAEAAYRDALTVQPKMADAYLNLGALLYEQGRSAEAVQLYRQAVRHCPDEALLYFNWALAFEETGDIHSAVEKYERCLALDPKIADAHFNAARLHELHGDLKKALQHFNAYRRLER
jgi:tetratricopeptide (TPR) repeat protein